MKQRIDLLLVENHLAPSREKAQALLLAGKVRVNGRPVDKAGQRIETTSQIEVLAKDHPYVSRGGLKLEQALQMFAIDVHNKTALDIGASTGGFTHCLLLHGAKQVFSVDVGYAQLAWELQHHPQVVSLERTNIRQLPFEVIGTQVDLVVIDASFISLKLIFPEAWRFLKPGGQVIALIKPQFEAGAQEVRRGGRVTNTAVHARVIREIEDAAQRQGFEVKQWMASQTPGKKSGNKEFFMLLSKPEL